MIRLAIRRYIATHHGIARKLLALFVRLHNYSYHKISEYAGYLNNHVHPKHYITKYHDFFVEQLEPTDDVIDLGSGSGFLSYDMAKKTQSVFGIDISKTNVKNAKRDYTRDNLTFVEGDITLYQFEKSFDKAVLSNVLEHIEDRIALLRRVHEIAPILLVRVPMITRSWLAVYKKQEGFEYRMDATHFIEYTLEEFFNEAKQSGWRVASHKVIWGELWAVLERV